MSTVDDDPTTLDPTTLDADQLRDAVRDRYAAAARQATETLAAGGTASCCAPAGSSAGASCCSPTGTAVAGSAVGADAITRDLYDDEAVATSPDALAASLGCGNPTALADLTPGQTVLDLGSGGGLDVLLSARRVGPTGKAYGLDMTPEMLALARRNQAEAGVENAEFLLGTIEHVPLPDSSVDVIISNCVINLAADKRRVLREAARVLRPGGRFAVSDVIADPGMDDATRADMRQWTGCIAGALTRDELAAALEDAGFVDLEIRETHRVHEHAGSAIVRARRPG